MRHFSKIAYHLQSASKLFVSCGLLTIGAAQADLDDWYYNQHKAASAPVDVAAESTAKNLVERPNFSGTWLLDKSASDNPEEVFKESLAKRKRPSFFPGGGMPGRGSGMGPGGFGRPPIGGMDKRKEFDKRPLAELSVDQLEIRHAEPELIIVADQLDKQRIFTDFRGSSISALGGMQQKVVTAGWESNVLVIESRTSGVNVTIQRLRLLANPRRLERVTEIPSPGPEGESIKIKQIFTWRE